MGKAIILRTLLVSLSWSLMVYNCVKKLSAAVLLIHFYFLLLLFTLVK